MQWLRPQALLGLLLLLPLWWALRRAHRPVRWIWPSLLLWERALAHAPQRTPVRPHRPPPAAWWWSAAALVALVLAAAGPSVPGPPSAHVGLVIDVSPSTAAAAAQGGSRRERIEALAARLRALADRDRLSDRRVQSPHGDEEDSDPLREAALALRNEGCDLVVVISDHHLERPWDEGAAGWLSLVAAAPRGGNAAVLGLGARWPGAVSPTAATSAPARVELLGRVAGAGGAIAALEVEIGAGGRVLHRQRLGLAGFEAPAVVRETIELETLQPIELRVRALSSGGRPAADALALDDALTVPPPSQGPGVWVAEGGPASLPAPLRAALEALGVRWLERDDPSVELEVLTGAADAVAPGARPRLWLASPPPAPTAAPPLWLVPGGVLEHVDLAGLRLPVGPARAPAVLDPLVVDARGRIAVGWLEQAAAAPLAWIGLPLADARVRAAWSGHPSLPVLVAELVEALIGRRLGERVTVRERSGAESAQAALGAPDPDPGRAFSDRLAAARERSRHRARRELAPALAVLALALLGGAWTLGDRGGRMGG